MRAVVISGPSESGSNLTITDVPEPTPGPGEILVSVRYGGLNFADTMIAKGIYPHPKGYPIVAGLEISGSVVAIGPGVTGLAVGDHVAAFSEEAGGYAELCAVPAERAVKLPDTIGFDVGAAFLIQAMTAWNMLHTVTDTKPGDIILVHAIGGGVGLYLTQLGRLAGATVIGTVGTKGKETRAREYGADRVINRGEEDFVKAVMEFTNGRGVDKVMDSTGASILDRSFAVIRRRGHVVSIGEAEGRPYETLWERLVPKSLTFTRFHLGHADFASGSWRRGVEVILGGIADGTIKVPIEGVFPFEEAQAMFDRLGSRQVGGKLLLAIAP